MTSFWEIIFFLFTNICLGLPNKAGQIAKEISQTKDQPHHQQNRQSVNQGPVWSACFLDLEGLVELIQIMAFLKRKGIPMILLTSIGDNSSTSLATHVLRLATREKLYSKIGSFSTDTSITFLLECLYAGVFAKDFERNLTLRKNASKFIEFDRSSSSKILKEE